MKKQTNKDLTNTDLLKKFLTDPKISREYCVNIYKDISNLINNEQEMLSLNLLAKQHQKTLFQVFYYSLTGRPINRLTSFKYIDPKSNITYMKNVIELEDEGLIFCEKLSNYDDEDNLRIYLPFFYINKLMKANRELQDFHYPRKFETPTKTKNYATNEKDDLIAFLLRIQILFINDKQQKKNRMQNQNQTILLFKKIFFQTKEKEIISKYLFSNLKISVKVHCFDIKELQLNPCNCNNPEIPEYSKTGQIKSSNFKNLLIDSKSKLCEEYIGFLNVSGSPFADSFLILPILEQDQEKALQLWKQQLNTILKNTQYGSNLWKLNNKKVLQNLKKPKYLIIF
ncbi:hypothetical protein M0812_08929 [Anaeramoeba flamelloides]|uniref:Uncharacterized protein n=1 Tax=Anaeramoeba flamelloides TaxID=1746091 RepID=A0AAV7ZNB6_9EUKA|nr:hypothetical protein M0812_08929 [Anaeramoeba flamelloides]